MPRVLAIDDDPQALRELQRDLRDLRAELVIERDPRAALARLDDAEFDVVIAACRLPGVDGLQVLTDVRRRHPATLRLMLIGHSDMRGRGGALNAAGIFRFLAKPWGAPELREALGAALAQRERLLATRRALQAALPGEELSIRRRLSAGELRKLANA